MLHLYSSDSDFDLVANLTALILLFAVERPGCRGRGMGSTDWAPCVSAIKSSGLGEAGQDVGPCSTKVSCMSLYLHGLQRALAASLTGALEGFFILLQRP